MVNILPIRMLLLLLGYLLCSGEVNGDKSVTVSIDASKEKWTISKYLATTHITYSSAADSIYNDTLVDWYNKNNIRSARYPGGTPAAIWNWEYPCGKMDCYTLDPRYKKLNRADGKEWMNISEYMDFVDETNIKPLIGVNYKCGIEGQKKAWPHCYLDDSLRRAWRLADYVANTRKHKGAFYYIGNEDEIIASTERWKKHAQTIKGVDPTAKTIFNFNYLNAIDLKTIIKGGWKNGVAYEIPGIGIENVDGAEFHSKWPGFCAYDDNVKEQKHKYCVVTPEEWMNEVPLIDHEHPELGSFRKRTQEMRDALEIMGVDKDFMLANNEFGMNWHFRSYPGFNRYTLSLVNLELGLEMFKSGLDSMALWDTVGGGFTGKTMLLDKQYDNRMNPVHFGLEMLWKSVEMGMLEMTTSEKRLHGFCATNWDTKMICYLLNKYNADKTVEFTGEGIYQQIGLLPRNAKVTIETLEDPDGPLNAEEGKKWFEQWKGHWGEVKKEIKNLNLEKDQKFTHTIPPLSFVSFEFLRPT